MSFEGRGERWDKYRKETGENYYIIIEKENKNILKSYFLSRLVKIEENETESGGIFFFVQPLKIVDVCIVEKTFEDYLVLSPIHFFMLWKDWKWLGGKNLEKGKVVEMKEKKELINSYFRKN